MERCRSVLPAICAVCAVAIPLSACNRTDRTTYDAAMRCLTNELASHEYVDQIYDPNTMFWEDRKRLEILRSRAVSAGELIGIPAERTYGDTWQATDEIIHRHENAQIAAVKRFKIARACLPQPAGFIRYTGWKP